jgi:hypothetical protein
LDQDASSQMHEIVPCYLEFGTSYDSNLNWLVYIYQQEQYKGVDVNSRVLYLLDHWVTIMRRKGPSRAIFIYDDPADWSLGAGILASKGFPPGYKVLGWHAKYDVFNMLFLDGYAASPYIDWTRNLADPPARPVSGTSTWVAHQEFGEQ